MTFAKKVGITFSMMAAASLSAHFVWMESSALKVGETARIRIGNGHEVGKSESAMSMDGLSSWALSPSGKKADLKFAADGKWLVTDFAVKEAGAHRFVMVQDRGVFSQTTKGFKPGGREVHPDAKKATKYWRSAIAYGSTDAKQEPQQPLGLDLELAAHKRGNDVHLTVYQSGNPLSGIALSIAVVGVEEGKEIGKSDAQGKFVYKVPSGSKGPVVFLATILKEAPQGSNYDVSNKTAAAYLNW